MVLKEILERDNVNEKPQRIISVPLCESQIFDIDVSKRDEGIDVSFSHTCDGISGEFDFRLYYARVEGTLTSNGTILTFFAYKTSNCELRNTIMFSAFLSRNEERMLYKLIISKLL